MENDYYLRMTYEFVHNLAISLSPEVDVLDWPIEDRVKIVVEHFKKCNTTLIDNIVVKYSSVLEFVHLQIACDPRELQRMKLLHGTPFIQFNTDAGDNDCWLKLMITKL